MYGAAELAALIDRLANPVLYDSYGDDQADVWRSFIQTKPIEHLYGEKIRTIQSVGAFVETEDGEDAPADQPLRGPVAYLKVRPFTRRIVIPGRVLEAADSMAMEKELRPLITEAAEQFGRQARLTKEDWIADMFQKGTLTAGNKALFDNSYQDEAQPSPGFIYDGLPWFDTAHTITGGSGTYANHIVSAALTTTTLQNALIAFTKTNAVDERGRRVPVRPTHLVCPTDMERTALQVVNSPLEPGSSINAINPYYGKLTVVPWNALRDSASASSWWLVDATNSSGLRVRDSGMPTQRLGYDEIKDVYHVIFRYLFGATVFNWRYAHANNKAAS